MAVSDVDFREPEFHALGEDVGDCWRFSGVCFHKGVIGPPSDLAASRGAAAARRVSA